MNVLITNDDGINAIGIWKIAKKLSTLHNVTIVAPNSNRSGTSSSLSIGATFKATKVDMVDGITSYSITGSPSDCVKFAHLTLQTHFDLVISGINNGFNIGNAILYSGTVGATVEGLTCGYNSIAFSAPTNTKHLDDLTNRAVEIVDLLSKYPKSCWNVNFPNCDPNEIKGIKFAKVGKVLYTDHYKLCENGEYLLAGDLLYNPSHETDTDVYFLKEKYITITPISLEKTDFSILNNL